MKAFLSYSRVDEKIAKRLHSKLTLLGFQVWFDRRSLTGGDPWKAEIKKAIHVSDMVIILFSSRNVDRRGFFHAEVRLVLDVLDTVPIDSRYVLPCRLDDCLIPTPLDAYHGVDLFPKFENGFKKLLNALSKPHAASAKTEPHSSLLELRKNLERLAKKGEMEAMFRLGQLLVQEGTSTGDRRLALKWLQKAVTAGHRDALWHLGRLYGVGPSRESYVRARRIFQKAAEQGDSDAMNDLGVLYEHGRGVKRNYVKARTYYEQSAKHGNRDGMFNLGSILDRGLGVPMDYQAAKIWYEQSAALGHASAMFNLAYMYSHGNGVKPNEKRAFQLYKEAAGAGDADAMNNLGSMCQHGQGTRKSYRQAYSWYKKAADLGNARAKDNLRRLQAAEQKRLLGV